MSETSHAEKVQRIMERVRDSLKAYGLVESQIIEDVVTIVSQIVYEELP